MATGYIARRSKREGFLLPAGQQAAFTLEAGSYLLYSFGAYASVRKYAMVFVTTGGTLYITTIYAYDTDNVPLTSPENFTLLVKDMHASSNAQIYIEPMADSTPLPDYSMSEIPQG